MQAPTRELLSARTVMRRAISPRSVPSHAIVSFSELSHKHILTVDQILASSVLTVTRVSLSFAYIGHS